MTEFRSTRGERSYQMARKLPGGNECVFCSKEMNKRSIKSSAKLFRVISNDYPYSLWDSNRVTGHLMIVPVRHVIGINEFTEPESREYVRTLSEYEKKGYNLYARAPGSGVKSVPHQHTHLIKIEGKDKKFIFYIRKPRVRIVL